MRYPTNPKSGTGIPKGYANGLFRTVSQPVDIQTIEALRKKLCDTYIAIATPISDKTKIILLIVLALILAMSM